MGRFDEVLVVFISVEKVDEINFDEVVEKVVKEIEDVVF